MLLPHTRRPARAGRKSSRRRAGFTLIEIMAVVLIMGLLMGLVGVSVFGQIDKARIMTTRAKITQLEQALELYRMDNARYPSSEQGLEALISETQGARHFPPGGYLKKGKEALEDSWGNAFQYQAPGSNNPHTFDIWSNGPDGTAGGDDIGNWTSENEG